MVYQFERLFVVDAGKHTCAFGGGEATTYLDGIRQTTRLVPPWLCKQGDARLEYLLTGWFTPVSAGDQHYQEQATNVPPL